MGKADLAPNAECVVVIRAKVSPTLGAANGSVTITATQLENTPFTVANVSVPAPLDGTFGRLRAVRLGPDGALYVSTSNGTDDKLLKLTGVV